RSGTSVASVDGGTSGAEGHRLGWAAVVGGGSEEGIGDRYAAAGRVTKLKVVSAVEGDARSQHAVAAAVAGDDGVVHEGDRRAGVDINSAARGRRCISGDGAVGDRYRPDADVDRSSFCDGTGG